MPNELGLTMAAPCGTLTTTVVAAPALTKVFRPGLHCSYFALCIHYFQSRFNNEECKVGEAGQEKKLWSS